MKDSPDAVERCYTAFAELSSKKAFEKIYASEIIAAAGVSRSHFYRLFQDKYDLLDKMIGRNLSAVYTQDCDLDGWNDRIVAFLTMVRQYRHVLSGKYNHELLLKKYFNAFQHLFELRFQRLGNNDLPASVLKLIRFSCAGISIIIVDWVDSDCLEEPALVADTIVEAIPPTLYELCI